MKNLKKAAQAQGMKMIYLNSAAGAKTWTGNAAARGEYILVKAGKSIALGVENIKSTLDL